MSKRIVKESDLPEVAVTESVEVEPWAGKKITSITEDGKLEDPTAEFVAVGHPYLRRTKDADRILYIPKIGALNLDPVGFSDTFGCAICKVVKDKG